MGCAIAIVLVVGLAGAGMLLAAGAALSDRATPAGATAALSIIGLVLLAAAVAFLRYARKVVRDFEEQQRRRAEFPHQPWKWRKEWCDPVVKSRQGAGVGGAWFVAVFVCGISAPVVFGVLSKPDVPKPVYIGLIFPAIGLTLLAHAIYRTLQWRKFGSPRLVLTTVPGCIGGYLGGVIEVPARVTPEQDVALALRCVRRVTTGSGKSRRTTETTLWEREERLPADRWTGDSGAAEIPALFHIPAGQPDTDIDNPNNQIVWRLSLHAAEAGIDLSTTFDVPVFATGETAPPPATGAPALEVYRPQPFGAAELARVGIIRDLDGWKFNPNHLWLPRIVSLLIACLLTTGLWLLAGQNAPWIAWVLVGAFALVAWLFTLDLWFARSELRIEREDVVVREWRWNGFREWRIPRGSIAEIRTAPGMRIGSTQYHQLRLVRHESSGPGPAVVIGALTPSAGTVPVPSRRLETPFVRHVRGSALSTALRQMIEADIRRGL